MEKKSEIEELLKFAASNPEAVVAMCYDPETGKMEKVGLDEAIEAVKNGAPMSDSPEKAVSLMAQTYAIKTKEAITLLEKAVKSGDVDVMEAILLKVQGLIEEKLEIVQMLQSTRNEDKCPCGQCKE